MEVNTWNKADRKLVPQNWQRGVGITFSILHCPLSFMHVWMFYNEIHAKVNSRSSCWNDLCPSGTVPVFQMLAPVHSSHIPQSSLCYSPGISPLLTPSIASATANLHVPLKTGRAAVMLLGVCLVHGPYSFGTLAAPSLRLTFFLVWTEFKGLLRACEAPTGLEVLDA